MPFHQQTNGAKRQWGGAAPSGGWRQKALFKIFSNLAALCIALTMMAAPCAANAGATEIYDLGASKRGIIDEFFQPSAFKRAEKARTIGPHLLQALKENDVKFVSRLSKKDVAAVFLHLRTGNSGNLLHLAAEGNIAIEASFLRLLDKLPLRAARKALTLKDDDGLTPEELVRKHNNRPAYHAVLYLTERYRERNHRLDLAAGWAGFAGVGGGAIYALSSNSFFEGFLPGAAIAGASFAASACMKSFLNKKQVKGLSHSL